MKRNNLNYSFSLAAILFPLLTAIMSNAQDSVKSPLIITLSYFERNNKLQYLIVNAKAKVSGRFEPVAGAEIKLYLNKDTAGRPAGFIGEVVTGEKGNATTNIPPSLAEIWKSSESHIFIAVTDKTKQFDATNTESGITKARIILDTISDKFITATFSEFKDNHWTPVKGVEIKLAIKRLGGDLLINDDQSYTSDSMGQVKGEFKRIGLPGDAAGNIILVAKVEDNDQYGNLRIEKQEPWATKFVADKDFFHRALWASQFHSPVWLVMIAYSIIITVWGTLIYLVFLILKIRKLGNDNQ